MTQNTRYQIWIAIAAAAIFFTNLGVAGLWDEDETLYASCAREMLQRGDWVTPYFNGHLFPDKPPLMFWTMMAGFKIFGVNELGARFFSAVLGLGTALLVYHMGKRLFDLRTAFLSGIITASSIIFTVSARAATVDAALVFVTTTAVFAFIVGMIRKSSAEGSTDVFAFQADRKLPLAVAALMYFALGLAVLSKGPVGFLLPMTAFGLFLMIGHCRVRLAAAPASPAGFVARYVRIAAAFFHPATFFRSLFQLRPFVGVIFVLAVALPWFVLVGLRTDGEWLRLFFGKFNLRPFVQPILGHSGPFWYYVPAVLIGFFPWSIFLGPAFADAGRRIRRKEAEGDALILLASWFAVFFFFWSICSTKLPHYPLPAYPALALLTAAFLERWIADPARISSRWMNAAWLSSVLGGVTILVALPIAATIYLPGEQWLGAFAIILIVGAGAAWRFASQGKNLSAVHAYAVTSVVFLTAAFGIAANRVDAFQNARPIVAAIQADAEKNGIPADVPLCAYRFFRQSEVYYANRQVTHCGAPGEAAAMSQLDDFLTQKGHAYIITLDKYRAEIDARYPNQFTLLVDQPRFLAKDRMIVLALKTDAVGVVGRSASADQK